MKDMFGIPLNVGDKVIYTTGARSNTILEVGTILEITDNRAYLRSKSGRKLTNCRYESTLASINPIQAQHPELFI